MQFGVIIIGDEILSGKRQDKHLTKAIATLGLRGLEISWAQYLGDDPELIVSTLQRTLVTEDVVFSFGGIGATPDDYTRQSAARAAGVALRLHPEAEAEIRGRFTDDPRGVTPQRLMMGEFPEGASIIPNPYNRIPGFSVRHHHFLPGFPEMAWPMLEWILENRYAHASAERAIEAAIIVREAGESHLIELMNECVRAYPGLKVFSLPRMTPERFIELGVRGNAVQVTAAIVMLQSGVSGLGFPWTPVQN